MNTKVFFFLSGWSFRDTDKRNGRRIIGWKKRNKDNQRKNRQGTVQRHRNKMWRFSIFLFDSDWGRRNGFCFVFFPSVWKWQDMENITRNNRPGQRVVIHSKRFHPVRATSVQVRTGQFETKKPFFLISWQNKKLKSDGRLWKREPWSSFQCSHATPW